jgi:hypothetical protein
MVDSLLWWSCGAQFLFWFFDRVLVWQIMYVGGGFKMLLGLTQLPLHYPHTYSPTPHTMKCNKRKLGFVWFERKKVDGEKITKIDG